MCINILILQGIVYTAEISRLHDITTITRLMFGSSFKKVYSLCKDRNIGVGYESNSDGFSFVFYRNNVTLNVTVNPIVKLTTNDYKVLNLLKENPIQK